ncbi:MAG: HD domain-containing protein [Chthoniobacterales bacterium]|nr:HD domain-containing protein [Chthoniobacterales bacterium]
MDFQHPDEIGASELILSGRGATSLSERIGAVHAHLRRVVPQVDRLACALYDPEMDLLKTFVNSTVGGEPLKTYQYKLADCPSLLALKSEGKSRVIDDISLTLKSKTEHTRWVKGMGYRSSYTVPIYYQGIFEGFLFFDSCTPGAFTPEVVGRLEVYMNLIMLMVAHEVTIVQALVGSVRVARDLANLRDEETGAHLDRMSRICRLIARGLAKSHNLSDEFIEQLFLFSPLHDIGKIGIPDSVLRKPGAFTPEERAVMEGHVKLGVDMLDRLVDDFNLRAVAGIDILRNLAGGHHEFLDGSGYPKHVAGGAIPLEARIVTVADIFDALTSKRVYKGAWTVDQAFDSMDKMVADGKLDAECVAALRANKEEALGIIERFSESPEEGTLLARVP